MVHISGPRGRATAPIMNLPVQGKVNRDGGRHAHRGVGRGSRDNHQDAAVLRGERSAPADRACRQRVPRLRAGGPFTAGLHPPRPGRRPDPRPDPRGDRHPRRRRRTLPSCVPCLRSDCSTSIVRSPTSRPCAPPSSNDATKPNRPIRPPVPPRRSVDTCDVPLLRPLRAPERLAAAEAPASALVALSCRREHVKRRMMRLDGRRWATLRNRRWAEGFLAAATKRSTTTNGRVAVSWAMKAKPLPSSCQNTPGTGPLSDESSWAVRSTRRVGAPCTSLTA